MPDARVVYRSKGDINRELERVKRDLPFYFKTFPTLHVAFWFCEAIYNIKRETLQNLWCGPTNIHLIPCPYWQVSDKFPNRNLAVISTQTRMFPGDWNKVRKLVAVKFRTRDIRQYNTLATRKSWLSTSRNTTIDKLTHNTFVAKRSDSCVVL